MALRYEDEQNVIARAYGRYFLNGEDMLNMTPAVLQLTMNGLYLFDRRRAENYQGEMYAHLDLHLSWSDFDMVGQGDAGGKRYLFVPYRGEEPLFTFISDENSHKDIKTLLKDIRSIGIPII
ncbi:MAG: hypothetical protein IJU20_00380 [Clostridia bacterium]|nr:hypothetical protein [Clostridia bacterium]